MTTGIYPQFEKAKKQKKLAVLIDPDSLRLQHLGGIIDQLQKTSVDFLFVGGSLILDDQLNSCLDLLRKETDCPLILFPGSALQISAKADAILFLSLISGRNPEYLIGQHVVAAPYIQAAGLEVISTGYMLVDGGKPTTASYMSNAMPIPRDKDEIAVCTALAGQMLGLRTIYMDAGSGAEKAITTSMTQAVAEAIQIPIIVGGGIRKPQQAHAHLKAGADIIVVGTGIEKDPGLLSEMLAAVHNT